MRRTFNCGIGLVIIVPASEADGVLKKLRLLKEKAYLIGEIVKRGKGDQGVVIR
jgi:phosphoribosylformylglycinamidine cyclo-ligase